MAVSGSGHQLQIGLVGQGGELERLGLLALTVHPLADAALHIGDGALVADGTQFHKTGHGGVGNRHHALLGQGAHPHAAESQALGRQVALVGNGVFPEGFGVFLAVDDRVN